jgi:hypothetical protein
MTKSNWMDRMMSDETAVMPPPPPPAYEDLAMFKTLDHQQILFREIATGELWGELGVYSVCDKVTYHVTDADAWIADFKPALRCDPLTREYLDPDAAHAVLNAPPVNDDGAALQKRTESNSERSDR